MSGSNKLDTSGDAAQAAGNTKQQQQQRRPAKSRPSINVNEDNNKNTASEQCTLKDIVQSQGRDAKTLVSWRVENETSPVNRLANTTAVADTGIQKKPTSTTASSPKGPRIQTERLSPRKSSTNVSPSSTTSSSSSANLQQRKIQKAWDYMLDNLRRTVDDLYLTLCELGATEEQCLDVLEVLNESVKDFTDLIEVVRVDQCDSIQEPDAHSTKSVAWQMRKISSPHKNGTAPPRIAWSDIPLDYDDDEHFSQSYDVNNYNPNNHTSSTTEANNNSNTSESNKLTQSYDMPQNGDYLSSNIWSPRSQDTVVVELGHNAKRRLNLADDAGTNANIIAPVLGQTPLISGASKDEQHQHNVHSVQQLTYIHQLQPRQSQDALTKMMGGQSLILPPEVDREATNKHLWMEGNITFGDMGAPTPKTHSVLSPSRSSSRAKHEKFASPESRKMMSPEDILRHHAEKQEKAERNRKRLKSEKKKKLKEAAKKIELAEQRQAEKLAQQLQEVEKKLIRADQIHEAHIQEIARKAMVENTKVGEIAFIQSHITEHKKMDLQKKLDEGNARRLEKLADSMKKVKEEMARQEAVSERRKALEETRLFKLKIKQESRKDKERRIEAERQRALLMRGARAEEHAHRVKVHTTIVQKEAEEKERKLAQKMKETIERKNENLEKRREKASMDLEKVKEVTTRKVNPEEKSVPSKASAGGDKEKVAAPKATTETNSDAPSAVVVNCELEAEKKLAREAINKKLQKIRQRLATLCKDYSKEYAPSQVPNPSTPTADVSTESQSAQSASTTSSRAAEVSTNPRLHKIFQELTEAIQSSSKTKIDAVKSPIQELLRLLDNKKPNDLHFIRQDGGIDTLIQICTLPVLPPSSPVTKFAFKAFSTVCSLKENTMYLVRTCKVLPLITLLASSINKDEAYVPYLINIITLCIRNGFSEPQPGAAFDEKERRIKEELINFMITSGVLNEMTLRFAQVKTPLDPTSPVPNIINNCLKLLEGLTAFAEERIPQKPVYVPSTVGANIIANLKETKLASIMSLLTSLLLHSGPPRGTLFPMIPHTILNTALIAMKVINNIALLDLKFVQEIIAGAELQNEFYHVLSHLLTYCCSHTEVTDNSPSAPSSITNANVSITTSIATYGNFGIGSAASSSSSVGSSASSSSSFASSSGSQVRELLHELLLVIGYVCYQNDSNQQLLQYGKCPTLLQKLCSLPIQYFSDPRYKQIFFPTLVVLCCSGGDRYGSATATQSHGNERNRSILQTEMSTELIIEFIKKEKDAAAAAAGAGTSKTTTTATTTSSTSKNKTKVIIDDERFSFINRYPLEHWDDAIEFLSATTPASPVGPSPSPTPPPSSNEGNAAAAGTGESTTTPSTAA